MYIKDQVIDKLNLKSANFLLMEYRTDTDSYFVYDKDIWVFLKLTISVKNKEVFENIVEAQSLQFTEKTRLKFEKLLQENRVNYMIVSSSNDTYEMIATQSFSTRNHYRSLSSDLDWSRYEKLHLNKMGLDRSVEEDDNATGYIKFINYDERPTYDPRKDARNKKPFNKDSKPRDSERREFKPREGQKREFKPREGQKREFKPRDGERREFKPRDGQKREFKPRDGERREFKPRDGQKRDYKPRDGERREFKARDGQKREFKPRDGERREFKPHEGQKREFKPRDGQKREFKPREGQKRDYKPRDGQTPKPYKPRTFNK